MDKAEASEEHQRIVRDAREKLSEKAQPIHNQ